VQKDSAQALLAECIRTLEHLEAATLSWDIPEMIPEIERSLAEVLFRLEGSSVRSAQRIKYFLSGYLSLGSFTGLTLPLLPEAHISAELYDHEKPFIIAHEKVHLHGRALESEANYIAILACLHAENPAIRYSGIYVLTSLLLSSLPKSERAVWRAQISRYSLHNLQASGIRLRLKNKNFVLLLRQIYSTYLKAQRIREGIANYSASLKLVLGFKIDNKNPLRFSANGRML